MKLFRGCGNPESAGSEWDQFPRSGLVDLLAVSQPKVCAFNRKNNFRVFYFTGTFKHKTQNKFVKSKGIRTRGTKRREALGNLTSAFSTAST